MLSIKLSSIFLSLNLHSLNYAFLVVLLDLNFVSTTMASDQVQPLSAFQKLGLHYRNVWHKMPHTSFVLVDEVLKRRCYQDVENRWARFL